MAIQKLGHVGIYARDLENMRDFYTRVVGLHIADESGNAVFMSSDPEREHHEFVIFRGNGPDQQTCVQQLSFSCEKLEDVVEYYQRFKDNGVRFRSVTTMRASAASELSVQSTKCSRRSERSRLTFNLVASGGGASGRAPQKCRLRSPSSYPAQA